MLIVGGVIVAVVAVVLVLSSGSGGKSAGPGSAGQRTAKTASSSTGGAHNHKHASSHHSESSAAAASPAATSVAVLNGTNTTGLAHSLSKDLQQSGYSQATALNGTPPGSHTVTVVEYTTGHRSDAEGVARAIAVTQVQPLETAVASLAGPATVVVVAGADKAAELGASGGETSG